MTRIDSLKLLRRNFNADLNVPVFCVRNTNLGELGVKQKETQKKSWDDVFAQNGKHPRETCMLYIWAVAVQAVAIPFRKQQQ